MQYNYKITLINLVYCYFRIHILTYNDIHVKTYHQCLFQVFFKFIVELFDRQYFKIEL